MYRNSHACTQELSGEVFSYDAMGTGLLVLRQPGDTAQQSDLRMIRRQYIAVRSSVPQYRLNVSAGSLFCRKSREH
jgi:hypothetical protein